MAEAWSDRFGGKVTGTAGSSAITAWTTTVTVMTNGNTTASVSGGCTAS